METPQTFNDSLPVPIIKSCAPRNWMEKLSGSLMFWSQYILSFLPWMNVNTAHKLDFQSNHELLCSDKLNWEAGADILSGCIFALLPLPPILLLVCSHFSDWYLCLCLCLYLYLYFCVCVCVCTCIFVFAVSDAYFTLTPTPSPNPSSCITPFRRPPRFIALKTPCHSIYRFILSFSSTKLHKRYILVTLVSL